MSFHSQATAGALHIIHQWEYIDATARGAATGFLATDVGKVAQQQSNNSYWILTDYSPITWVDITAGGTAPVSSVFGRTGAVVAAASDYDASQVDNDSSVSGATVAAALNALLASIPVFGQDYQTEVSIGRTTTTSTTFQTKVTLTTGTLTGTYRIGWHAVVDQSSIADAVQTQLYNTTDAVVVGVTQEHEPQDVNNRIAVGGFAEVVFSGAAKSFAIQYRQQRGNMAGIQDARIEIWRVA